MMAAYFTFLVPCISFLQNKKGLLFALFLFSLLIVIPLFQSLLFSKQYTHEGKISVNEFIDIPFLTTKEASKNIILFFGYVGCTDVCIPVLNQLKAMYEQIEFNTSRPHTDVIFINLIPGLSDKKVTQFTQSFNPEFKCIYLNQKQLNKITRQFRLFFSQNLFNKEKMNHTDYVYLLNRKSNDQFILQNIYNTHPFRPDLLISDLDK